MAEAWAEIVGTDGDKNLRAIFISASLVAGIEVGLDIPTVSSDTLKVLHKLG